MRKTLILLMICAGCSRIKQSVEHSDNLGFQVKTYGYDKLCIVTIANKWTYNLTESQIDSVKDADYKSVELALRKIDRHNQ